MTKGLRDEDPQRASDEVWVALARESGAPVADVFHALRRPMPEWLAGEDAGPRRDEQYRVVTKQLDTPFGQALEEIYEDLSVETEEWDEEEIAETERELAATFQRQYAAYMEQQEALRKRRRRRGRDAD